jgi:hypothetical protein
MNQTDDAILENMRLRAPDISPRDATNNIAIKIIINAYSTSPCPFSAGADNMVLSSFLDTYSFLRME